MSVREPDFTVELAGRVVGFRNMRPGQIAMVNLIIQQAQKRADEIGDVPAGVELIGKLFNMIETMILTAEDREHVMNAMMLGEIDMPEAYLILRHGKPLPPDDDEEPVKPVKKTRKSVR